MSNNKSHRGDAYKPALMTLSEEAELLRVNASRLMSARKHMAKHPEIVTKISRTYYFHTHLMYEYLNKGNPIDDLRSVELKMRRGYLANVKRHSKKRVVMNHIRTVPLQSFNVALAW